MRFLLTGAAGFIGFHLAKRLLEDGHTVHGFDAVTPYYDVTLKQRRAAILAASPNFTLTTGGVDDAAELDRAADAARPDVILHLAAQAGVRYSMENPRAYLDANIVGSWNVLEVARKSRPAHLLIASTSSVYGGSIAERPSRETDSTDTPLSFYAATKKSMESMAHAYAYNYGTPITALRFFTVYGPWGRPDMALFKFTDAILNQRPIEIYGNGEMKRDFTYVDDVVEAVVRLIGVVPAAGKRVSTSDSISAEAPYRVVNIAGGHPVALLDFVAMVEAAVGRKAQRKLLPMQPGDVRDTFADTTLLADLTGFKPTISAQEGVRRFVEWYAATFQASANA